MDRNPLLRPIGFCFASVQQHTTRRRGRIIHYLLYRRYTGDPAPYTDTKIGSFALILRAVHCGSSDGPDCRRTQPVHGSSSSSFAAEPSLGVASDYRRRAERPQYRRRAYGPRGRAA